VTNTFPASFPITFADGPQLSFTDKPASVASRMAEIESQVTSIDDYDIEKHDRRTVTVVVTYTP
jgi:hypothetical protein